MHGSPTTKIPYQSADLLYPFGSTRGLVVTGSGGLSGADYVGTFTYKIEDSYAYSASNASLSISAQN